MTSPRLLLALCGLTVHLFSGLLWGTAAAGQLEAQQWLQRVAGPAQKLSYTGTFVYRSGNQSETSRITHVARNGDQMERLVVLDGSPREVIRHNEEVKCYLPDSRLMIVEQRSARRTFPALLPVSLAGLGEHYVVSKGGRVRVAGFDAQLIRLEPRDALRHGRQFWIDTESGVLLRADILDDRGGPLESFAFTELHIGDPQGQEVLRSSFVDATDPKDAWQVRQVRARQIRDDGQWLFKGELPGFRRQVTMARDFPANSVSGTQEVIHWIYSDGLAAISVFISPLSGTADSNESGIQAMGAINVMKRMIDGHRIVVMGDVPASAIRRFAEGIQVRGK